MNEYNDKKYSTDENNGSSAYQPNWQSSTPNSSASGSSNQNTSDSYYNSSTSYNQEKPYQFQYDDYTSGGDNKKPPKKGKRGLVVFFSIIGVLVAVSLIFCAGYGIYVSLSGDNFIYSGATSSSALADENPASSAPSAQLNIASSPEIAGSAANDGGLTNEEIAARVSPSVVLISNYQQAGIAGEGSGVIMNEEGYIITNAHVIEDASGIGITLENGESYNATLVGTDPMTDLAVVKLVADTMPQLTAAEFGDSSKLVIGERVIAIGNAGGSEFSSSVTGGIISGLDRQINTETARLNVIQTDAAINPGNSGGALVNKYGQVIGINSAKFVREGYESLGFAIPINNAQPIINDLIQNGRVTGRPRLGIQGRDIYDAFAQYLGYSVSRGVQIVAIDPTCDISKKGVVVGDILTKMNGEAIVSMNDMKNDLIQFKPGDTVEFEVYRPASRTGGSGKTFTIQVVLDEDDGTSNFPQSDTQSQPDTETTPNYPFFPFQ